MNKPWKITVYQDKSHKWRWRLKAGNNEITGDGAQGYARRDSAIRAARRLWAAGLAGFVVEVAE